MNIPILDPDSDDFAEQFAFELWSVGGSSDYDNSRERPYNGQPHTDHGERGKVEVRGLTMRDVADCIVQGFLQSSGNLHLQKKAFERTREFIGTEHADNGTWRYSDLYKIDLGGIDPQAVIQNAMCQIEHYMGIYPNVPESARSAADELLNGTN